jgi:peptide/nickel transport system substrate-binding protein
MSDMTTNWVPGDDAMVEAAIRRGASRRDLLKIMLANGVALAAGSAILGRADRAIATTPVKGAH